MTKTYSEKLFEYNDNPIETIDLPDNVKCFTFFNYIAKLWTDIKFNLDKIRVTVSPDYYSIPPHLFEKIYLALHSPKIIPEFHVGTNFIEVKLGSRNTVTYCKMKIDKKSESNCYDYEHGDSIRSDCVTICVMKKLQNEIGDVDSLIHSFLVRKENFSKLRKFNKSRLYAIYENSHTKDAGIKMKEECLKQCKPDCSFTYYIHEITTTETSSNPPYIYSTISIQHNYLPDVYLQHLPETTFISFISNFGGLLGMWMGISVIVIFENIFSISKLIRKYYPKNQKVFIQSTSYNLNHFH